MVGKPSGSHKPAGKYTINLGLLGPCGEQASGQPVAHAVASAPLIPMKTFMRIGSLIVALGAAVLLAGCAGYRSTKPTSLSGTDFEVVETSTKRLLNSQEMIQLRAAVAQYLEKEGAVASGDYYVKVFLAPDKDGVPAEWVVVRFTRDTDLRFAVVGSYPANSYSTRSYASYDYYPYGYGSFGRLSFQYYDDPYYGRRYHFPPSRRNNGDRNRRHDRDNNHDRDRDGDRNRHVDHPRPPDTPRFKPIPTVGTPQVTRNGQDGDTSGRNNPHNPSQGNHRPRRGSPPGNQSGNPPAPPPAVQPAVQPASEPGPRRNSGGGYATRSELHRSQPARTESTVPARTSTPPQSSSPAPSYSPPAPRAESSQNNDSESAPRESGRTTFKPSGRN